MATKYLQHFPKPLLDDLIAGRWLPMIGAGFSRNALLPPRRTMPLWAELGEALGNELTDYSFTGPVDAISAYEHEYGRPRLIEKLTDTLLINEARPGPAHKAFCAIPFDIVCTTNFDFLIERQYELLSRHCTPLIDEDQLSVNLNETGVALLKLHGDINHPTRLVATESDYDGFLSRHPLMATFLANLLITRTAVFVGYSLDDPDFRAVWQVVRDRLGRSRRTAYAIMISPKPTDISRFDRRGVKVIGLPGGKLPYGQVLADAFEELHEYWRQRLIPASLVKEEQSLRELSLPIDVRTRLCFFAIPLSLQPFYRERVFPLVLEAGFVPVTADDVVSPGNSFLPKIDALLDRALLFVVEPSTPQTQIELGIALRKFDASRVLVIAEDIRTAPALFADIQFLKRPDLTSEDPEEFLSALRQWFEGAAERFGPSLSEEPARLLAAREFRAAVITAITLLETTLRQKIAIPTATDQLRGRPLLIRDLLDYARSKNMIRDVSVNVIMQWLRIRNEVVHTGRAVEKAQAEQIVNGVLDIVRSLGDV